MKKWSSINCVNMTNAHKTLSVFVVHELKGHRFRSREIKTAEYLKQNIEVIKDYVQKNYTYLQISYYFKQNFPIVTRGFSQRNIRLFYAKHGIGRLDNFEVDTIIQQSINEVFNVQFYVVNVE